MNAMISHRTDIQNQTEEQRIARERMALFPARAEVLYIASDIWVVSVPSSSCSLMRCVRADGLAACADSRS